MDRSSLTAEPPGGPSRVRRALGRVAAVTGILVATLLGLSVLLVVGVDIGLVALLTGVVVAVLPVPVYLGMALWIDRFEPEPFRLVGLAFFWGATVAVFFAFVVNSIGAVVVGSSLGEDAAELYGGSISAPVVEEVVKGAVIWIIYLRHRAEFDGILDGIVYAAMVGLGFAMVENVIYYGQGAYVEGIEGALATFILRGLLSPFAHPLFTSMTGIGFGIASRSTRRWVRVLAPLVGLVLAIVLHSLWNTAAAAGQFFGVYLLIMVPLFVAVLVVVLVARQRESAIVRRSLQPYVGVGLLTADEVDRLSQANQRRVAEKWVRARYGRAAVGALRDFYRAATELAYLRHRMERGLKLPAGADAERRLMAEVHHRRAALGALWRAAAPAPGAV